MNHSIATMLRAYAAWAEGATEVDVEAIKRSMNDEGPPVATNLAADLPVAEVIHALCMLTPVPVGISRPSNNPLPFKEKFQQLKLERSWLGWKDYSARDGPHPFGAVRGALTRVTARTNQPPQRDQQHWPLYRAPRTLSFPSWLRRRATL
jgi:hypothetical protein